MSVVFLNQKSINIGEFEDIGRFQISSTNIGEFTEKSVNLASLISMTNKLIICIKSSVSGDEQISFFLMADLERSNF